MTAARNREIDCVSVWKFDRFARSAPHLLAALEEFIIWACASTLVGGRLNASPRRSELRWDEPRAEGRPRRGGCAGNGVRAGRRRLVERDEAIPPALKGGAVQFLRRRPIHGLRN
jgi:hypothetical protein